MSGFKIRGIFNPVEDYYPTYVGIDNFDNFDEVLTSNEEYYFAASVLEEDGSIRPRDRQHSGFGEQSSFSKSLTEGTTICYEDEFSLPTPNMYLALGQILKERGIGLQQEKMPISSHKKRRDYLVSPFIILLITSVTIFPILSLLSPYG